jgi:hypothetical protein
MHTTTKLILAYNLEIKPSFAYQSSHQVVSKVLFSIYLVRQRVQINFQHFALLLLIIFSAQSCTTVHVYQTGGPGGREMGNAPSTEWKSDVSNTFLYGAIRDDVPIENCALGDGTRINIEEIKIEKNIWRIGLYIVTLGLWDSSKISWRCAKPCNP